MSRMPAIYRPPMGLPLNWKDEVSGELPKAIMAYIDYGAGKAKDKPTSEQVALIRDYLSYYIKAPCWAQNAQDPGMAADLKAAILKIDLMVSYEDIRDFIYACLDLGIDPL